MKFISNYPLILLITLAFVFPMQNSVAGPPAFEDGLLTTSETDSHVSFGDPRFVGLVYFFDLRERETYIQMTYINDGIAMGLEGIAHVQIFEVSNNCNENDFFDSYTVADTHVYNMRDIQTNDGKPSGVVLPDGSYGIVVITVRPIGFPFQFTRSIGNMRIIDDSGYEYRTNAQQAKNFSIIDPDAPQFIYSFNYNNLSGITFSDVVGISLLAVEINTLTSASEWDAQDVVNIYTAVDVDIYDLNEVPFSCRNVIFSCMDDDNPRLEELLENAQLASVASLEYGINEAIPHSRGGELLCPSNIIDKGIVNLTPLQFSFASFMNNTSPSGEFIPVPLFYGFVGLNNGNKRGSFDSINSTNLFAPLNPPPP